MRFFELARTPDFPVSHLIFHHSFSVSPISLTSSAGSSISLMALLRFSRCLATIFSASCEFLFKKASKI